MQKEHSLDFVSKIQRKIEIAQEIMLDDFVCKWLLKYVKEWKWKSAGKYNREITVQNTI